MFSSTIEIEKDDLFREFELSVLNLWSCLKFGRIGAYQDKVIKLYGLVSQCPEEWSYLTQTYWKTLLEFWDLEKALDNELVDFYDFSPDDLKKITNKVLNSFPNRYNFKYSIFNDKIQPISLNKI